MRLHLRKSNVVILIPETAGLSLSVGFSIQDETMDVARSLSCQRYLLAPLTGNKEGNKSLVVLRVKSTPTWFPINGLYTPMDNTPMHSISNVCHPWGSGWGNRLVRQISAVMGHKDSAKEKVRRGYRLILKVIIKLCFTVNQQTRQCRKDRVPTCSALQI